MKPAQKFLNAMLEMLKEKFPEDSSTICDFENIMLEESYNLTDTEHESINNFIEYIVDKTYANK